MALDITPKYNPANITSPVHFRMTQTTTDTLLYAIVDMSVNGDVTQVLVRADRVGATNVYNFDIYFDSVCRDAMSPFTTNVSSIFGNDTNNLNEPYLADNLDGWCDIGFDIEYFKEGTDGKPVTTGVTESVATGNYEVLNANRKYNEDFSLDYYINYQIGVYEQHAYTNAPNPYYLTAEENHFLTMPALEVQHVRVQTWSLPFTNIDTGYIEKTTVSQNSAFTLGVGVEQLDGATYAVGSVNIKNPNVDYYTIEWGILLGEPGNYSFQNYSEVREYYLKDGCASRSLRVHFMNTLGGADAFTFTSFKKLFSVNKSKLGQTPIEYDVTLTDPIVRSNRGIFKMNNTNSDVYEVESGYLPTEQLEWVQEMFASPETYIETPLGLVPCVISDERVQVSDTDNLLTVSATITLTPNSVHTY